MDIVKLPRAEYKRLQEIERSFEAVQKLLFAHVFIKPATKNQRTILLEMKRTRRYSTAFLKSLAQGLKESSYFNA